LFCPPRFSPFSFLYPSNPQCHIRSPSKDWVKLDLADILVRTPPPTVRRHRQIAASGRDP
jgi:hypothetical protein